MKFIRSFSPLIHRLIKEGTLPQLNGENPKFKELFLMCCQKNPTTRPQLTTIIQKIEESFPPFLVQQIKSQTMMQ
jgi:hypothetical protein